MVVTWVSFVFIWFRDRYDGGPSPIIRETLGGPEIIIDFKEDVQGGGWEVLKKKVVYFIRTLGGIA